MSRTDSLFPHSRTHVDRPMLGIGFMIASGVVMSVNDGFLKWTAATLPTGEIMAGRGIVSLVFILAVVAWGRQWSALRQVNPWGQAGRASMIVIATFLLVAAFRVMPLADAIALAFVSPILTAALAPVLLREQVGWRRWVAVVIGFGGAVVMLRPGGGFLWIALLPLGVAVCDTFRDVITRRLSSQDSSLAIVFYTTLAVTIVGLATLPFDYVPPRSIDYVYLTVIGVLLVAANFLMIEAFRHAEATVVSPFRYIILIWAMLVGFIVFGDVPGIWTIVGAVVIVASGLFIWHRERVLTKAAARAGT